MITSSYPTGIDDPRGIFIHRLAQSLTDRGAQVAVLAPATPTSTGRAVLDGVRVERVRYWRTSGQTLTKGIAGMAPTLQAHPWLAVQVLPMFAHMARRTLLMAPQFDVIHAHWLYPSGAVATLARRRRATPLVVTSHGSDMALARQWRLLRWLSRQVLSRADVAVGVSRFLYEELKALSSNNEQVRFIPLGVKLPNGFPIKTDPAPELARFACHDGLRMVFVGRLVRSKDPRTLLDAHAELVRRGHRVSTALIGSGPEESPLRARMAELGLQDVLLLGTKPPGLVPSWLRAADVLILPSLSEGRGMVLLEAMAHGLPVVASDIPGPREVVKPGVTGFLFPPGEAKVLADKAETLIREPGRRRQMGRRGPDWLRENDLTAESTARRYLSLYQEVRARSSSGK